MQTGLGTMVAFRNDGYLGTYCRGGPPWPPGVELDPLKPITRFTKRSIPRRAATEGRPYSTFRRACSIAEAVGFLPVHNSNWSFAWATSISRPPSVRAPTATASRINLVSLGL